jgi:serine/threonine protein kinase/tetratricopeptide (TPR) repeat protein
MAIAIPGCALDAKIGEGGMGSVWKGTHRPTGKTVAVKILHPALARNRGYVERFLREIRTALTLDHPNIVRGIEAGESEGTYYFVMDYFEGEPLSQVIRREGQADEVWALEVLAQVLRAVDYAWRRGFIHRDIKPQNILVNRSGEVRLTDLGLAKFLDDAALTQVGMTLGTPHYIAPERARGDADQDVRADIYSIGATLYHLLTGQTLYSAGTSAEILAKQVTEPAPDPRRLRPNLNGWVVDILTRSLEKDPRRRYSTPSEMLGDIEGLLEGKEPEHLQPPRIVRERATLPLRSSTATLKIALAVIAALIVAGIAVLVARPSSSPPPRPAPVVREKPREETPKSPEIVEPAPAPLPERLAQLIAAGSLDLAWTQLRREGSSLPAEEAQRFGEEILRKLADRDYPRAHEEAEAAMAAGELDRALALLRAHKEKSQENRFLVDRLEERIAWIEAEKMRRARGDVRAGSEEEAVLAAARDKIDNKRAAEAAEDLRKFLYRFPERRDARLLLARALVAGGQAEVALKELEGLIAADPKNPELYRLRLEVSEAIPSMEQIVNSISLIGALAPLDAALLLRRAQALISLNRHGEAIQDLDRMAELDPGALPPRRIKASLMIQLKRYAEALAPLSEIIEGHPKDPQAFLDRGLCHIQLNRLEEAQVDFKQALVLDPNLGEARAGLKEIEARLRNPVRPAGREGAVPLFDGKTRDGWGVNPDLRVDVKDGNLAVRGATRDDARLLIHAFDLEDAYTIHAMIKTTLNFRGKDKDEVNQYVGFVLGHKRLAPYHVVHFSGNHLIVERVHVTENATERHFVAASTLASLDLSRWTEFEISVAKDKLKVKSGEIELLAETTIPQADFRGPLALILRTGTELQCRWIDVVAPKPPAPRAGARYDPKSKEWNRFGALESVEGGVIAAPSGGDGQSASWATVKPPGPAYEIETSLEIGVSGPGLALIFFQAYDRHCALALGYNEKNNEKLAVGLFGEFKGRFLFYNNDLHVIARPGNLQIKKKNAYRVCVLPTRVEIFANDERIFVESKDEFVKKIDHARSVGDKNGVRARELGAGLGAWDVSRRDTKSIRAEFRGFVVRPVR